MCKTRCPDLFAIESAHFIDDLSHTFVNLMMIEVTRQLIRALRVEKRVLMAKAARDRHHPHLGSHNQTLSSPLATL